MSVHITFKAYSEKKRCAFLQPHLAFWMVSISDDCPLHEMSHCLMNDLLHKKQATAKNKTNKVEEREW